MAHYKEQLDGSTSRSSVRSKWKRWAKRQMSKAQRRVGKKMLEEAPVRKRFVGCET